MLNCPVTRQKLFVEGISLLDDFNRVDAILARVEELRYVRAEVLELRKKFTAIYEPLKWGN